MSTAFVQGFTEAPAPAQPAALAARGREALAAFAEAGLGAARAERWKYTALRALEARRFEPAAAAGAAPDASRLALPGVDGPRLVFVDGRFDPSLSTLPASGGSLRLRRFDADAAVADSIAARLAALASRGDDVFARLGLAFAVDGARIEVDAVGDGFAELHLVIAGSSARDVAWQLPLEVALAPGARLRLVEHHVDAEGHAGLGNILLAATLAEGATLEHLRLQQAGAEALRFARSELSVGRGARYAITSLELGAAVSRHELAASLDAAGADIEVRGLQLVGDRQRADTRLELRHAAGDTRSQTLWRSAADGRARAALGGAIAIAQGADGSDAALLTRGLLLSPTAEVDAQPVLEIDTDEVKASHGAAIGQLDPAALFYLRARGLPGREARALLTRAFCAEVLAAWPVEATRKALDALVAERLAGAAA